MEIYVPNIFEFVANLAATAVPDSTAGLLI